MYKRQAEGERLFAIVGFGASLGAVVGSRIVHRFISVLDVFELMLVGAALLGLQVAITNWVDRREARTSRPAAQAAPATHAAPAKRTNAFQMVFKTRYLLLMGLMLIITVSDVAQWIGGAPVLGGG